MKSLSLKLDIVADVVSFVPGVNVVVGTGGTLFHLFAAAYYKTRKDAYDINIKTDEYQEMHTSQMNQFKQIKKDLLRLILFVGPILQLRMDLKEYKRPSSWLFYNSKPLDFN